MAQAQYNASGGVILSFPYLAELIDELKCTVPYQAQAYDPSTKTWTISMLYAPAAVRLLKRYFPQTKVLYYRDDHDPFAEEDPFDEPPRYSANSKNDPFAVLYLLPTAPRCVVEAAYRALALREHPDHGGDTTVMQRINSAVEQCRKRAAG